MTLALLRKRKGSGIGKMRKEPWAVSDLQTGWRGWILQGEQQHLEGGFSKTEERWGQALQGSSPGPLGSRACVSSLSPGQAFLLLLLSLFTHVQLCAAPWTVAHQCPLSMEFSQNEYWSELPCPPPGDLPKPGIDPTSPAVPALQVDSLPISHWGSPWNPMVCSPPGSTVHGILRAWILEWVAISFSRGSSQPRNGTCISYVSCIGRRVLYPPPGLSGATLKIILISSSACLFTIF